MILVVGATGNVFYALVRTGRLDTVTPDVESVLGRTATPFDDWARENAGAFGVAP